MAPLLRRRRGGQPGNRNARKNGFYAAGVSPTLRNALRRAATLDDHALLDEIRLARAYLSELLRLEPENHDILVRVLNTITRLVAINHQLSPNQEHELGGALRELLAELMPDREV